jgi:hypothetical protein
LKKQVLDRRTQVLAWATTVLLLWPLFVVPGRAPWSGIIWAAALAGSFVVAATGLVGRELSRSPTLIGPSVEATPRAIADASRLRHCGAGSARRVNTVCEQRKEA